MISITKLINEIQMPKYWYHGSTIKISKFDYNMVGKRTEHLESIGWGIYFSTKNHAGAFGNVINTVKIDNNANILNEQVTKKQCRQIYKQLLKENGKDVFSEGLQQKWGEWLLNPEYGEYSILSDVKEFYWTFIEREIFNIENTKDMSNLLLRAGIDGIVIEESPDILIVFNDKIITVI